MAGNRIGYIMVSKVCLVIGVCCLLSGMLFRLERGEITFGIAFSWGIGLFFVVYGAILKKTFQGTYKRVHQFFGILLGVILLSFILVEAMIFQAMKTQLPEDCRYVIILGAGLLGDSPSLTLQQRLDAGIVVLKKYPDANVIVSGGLGKESVYTEAEVMKWYLISHGVNEDRILKEEQATRTDENFAFGKAIAEKNSGQAVEEIVIATSDYHMFRSKILASKYYDKVYGISAQSPFEIKIIYAIREYFALIKMELIDL